MALLSIAASGNTSYPPPHTTQVPQDDEAMHDEEGTEASRPASPSSYVNSWKKQFTTHRSDDIKDMIEKNKIKLSTIMQSNRGSSTIGQTSASDGTGLAANLLTPRQDDVMCSMHGLELCLAEKDGGGSQVESPYGTWTVTLGGNVTAKNSKKPIELPEVSKIPRYTTWTFLDRNQRMMEDQSAFHRKNIYYNADCGEALMFNDSEDEVEDEEKKREFNSYEDRLIRMTIEDCAMSDAALEALAQCFEKTSGDIKARYEIVKGENTEGSSKEVSKLNAKLKDVYHDKDLDAALDSFNNLFCRRCLVFDCKLHGCSQDLIFPAEKQSPWNSMDDVPCGIHCYKLATKHKDSVASSQHNSPSTRSSRKKDAHQMQNNSALVEDRNYSMEETNNEQSATDGHDSSRKEELVDKNICTQEDNLVSWKVIEQELLVKGVEIFGRNSCLIARNVLGGEKICSDVFQYMNYIENSSTSEGHDLGLGSFPGKRGRVPRLKRTSRSAVYHFIRKRIAARKGELRQHYNPCGCQSACGKQCPCLKNDTCEKFCGCPKACKNRFLGCNCAKAQCRSRQCPCFAADRECDPDMCKYCGVGCGDGSLGVPNQRGDNYGCQNMKLLLRQQQKVVLGRSDVSGWGAFVKNTVGKDECLGEYTGELISHREAAKRGQRYDRENSSFLFNLNTEFVLDAFRMGNKLKFANHSSDPNCHAKVMLVAGDHRVGIFANERINAGEEIFYDYHYAPDEAPAWALKADDATGAEDPGQSSSGSAKKANAPGAKDPGQSSSRRAKRPGQSSRGRPRKHAQ